MDFGGASVTHEADQRLGRCAADDRVVDDHHAFPADHAGNGVVLDLDPKVADRLSGLDEGPPYVVVADQTELEWEPAYLRVSESRGVAGVRDREHTVGVHRMLAGELAAQSPAGLVDAHAVQCRVGPREVDLLEDA